MHFFSYNGCITFLYGLERIGIKYDLVNIKTLLKFFHNPETKFKSIHIAGTNGKGSVASIINSYLVESKYKTGLYTSPHIKDFRERIIVNGKIIPKQYIIKFTNTVFNLIQKISPSFFEVTTTMAFQYFADCGVEYAVIEAGLGGRLDSTNILKPKLSIITSVSIDHTEYLGDTIEKIAFEKAGIIKKNIPVVVGKIPEKALNVIKDYSIKKNSELIESKKEKLFIPNFKKIKFPSLIGSFQYINIKTSISGILELTKFLDVTIFMKSLLNIKKNSNFYGRFEVISEKPFKIIDVSHNVEGIKTIRDNLKQFKYNNLFIVFGMMKDKEHKKCIRELEKFKAKVLLTKINYKRAEDPGELFKTVKDKNKFIIVSSVKNAIEYINLHSGKKDLILFTGSFYLISEVKKYL